jgi:hypothetical protein
MISFTQRSGRGRMSDVERCREAEVFRQVDAAFRAGDFEGLRVALGDPADFPDVRGPITIGHCLEYAIYHSRTMPASPR